MSINVLLDSLDRLAQEAVSDLLLPKEGDQGEQDGFTAITVVAGYMPPKSSRAERDPYPWVQILPVKSTAYEKYTAVDIEFRIGVFDRTEEGLRQMLNVAERLQLKLVNYFEEPLDGMFDLMGQMVWERADNAWPYWQGIIKTTWQMDPYRPDKKLIETVGKFND